MRVLLESAAVVEIETARQWYSDIDAGLALRFENAVAAAIDKAAANPMTFAVVYRGLRRVRTRTFPYSVYFQYSPERELVLVVACLHAKRSSFTLKRRT